MAKLIEHYCNDTTPYGTAHLEIMFNQYRTQIDHLRRRGTGAGSGSLVKVVHLLERLQQTLDRLKLFIDIQAHPEDNHLKFTLLYSLTYVAIEQYSTHYLRRSSIRMLAGSIAENKSQHGEHYITRNKREYLNMFFSTTGGGTLIALMALYKIHIGTLSFGQFATSALSGLNYGIGFMLIHMLHCTVATKQSAMTAASFAEQVELNEHGRTVENKLAKLLVDVHRSQSVAMFGNVMIAILLACIVSAAYAVNTQQPLLDAYTVAYQMKLVDIITQPTLWCTAIAGLWLFCSGIIAGFFDNRADHLDLHNRLTINPLLRKIMPTRACHAFAAYMCRHYGLLMGNFILDMLLGMTGSFSHLLDLPLDIRHVAFSSANLSYAVVSGNLDAKAFLLGLAGVLAIGAANLMVSFTLTLSVALHPRGIKISSISKLFNSVWVQIEVDPLLLVYPVQTKDRQENK